MIHFLYLCLLLSLRKMLVTAKVSRYFNTFLQVLYYPLGTANFLERKERLELNDKLDNGSG